MAFTRRTAKARSANHSGSTRASVDAIETVHNGNIDAHAIVCEDVARGAIDNSSSTPGRDTESNGALIASIPTENSAAAHAEVHSASTARTETVTEAGVQIERRETQTLIGTQATSNAQAPNSYPDAHQDLSTTDGHEYQQNIESTASPSSSKTEAEAEAKPRNKRNPKPACERTTFQGRTNRLASQSEGARPADRNNSKDVIECGSDNTTTSTKRPVKCLAHHSATPVEDPNSVNEVEGKKKATKGKGKAIDLLDTNFAGVGNKRKRVVGSGSDGIAPAPTDSGSSSPMARRTRRRVEAEAVDAANSSSSTELRRSIRTKRPSERAAEALASRVDQSTRPKAQSEEGRTPGSRHITETKGAKRKRVDTETRHLDPADDENRHRQKRRRFPLAAPRKRRTKKKVQSSQQDFFRFPTPEILRNPPPHIKVRECGDPEKSKARSTLTEEDFAADLLEETLEAWIASWTPGPIVNDHAEPEQAASQPAPSPPQDAESSHHDPSAHDEFETRPGFLSSNDATLVQLPQEELTASSNTTSEIPETGLPNEPVTRLIHHRTETGPVSGMDEMNLTHRVDVAVSLEPRDASDLDEQDRGVVNEDEDENNMNYAHTTPFEAHAAQIPESVKDNAIGNGEINETPAEQRASAFRSLISHARTLLGSIAEHFSFGKGVQLQEIPPPSPPALSSRPPTLPPVAAFQSEPHDVVDLTGSSPARPSLSRRQRRRGPIVPQRRWRRVGEDRQVERDFVRRRSPTPDELGRQRLAPEPSDELIQALRNGITYGCPSPVPTEYDSES